MKKTANEIESAGFVPAENLTSNPDCLHFNAKSLHEFGHRYFQMYEKLRKPDMVFGAKADNTAKSAMEEL